MADQVKAWRRRKSSGKKGKEGGEWGKLRVQQNRARRRQKDTVKKRSKRRLQRGPLSMSFGKKGHYGAEQATRKAVTPPSKGVEAREEQQRGM